MHYFLKRGNLSSVKANIQKSILLLANNSGRYTVYSKAKNTMTASTLSLCTREAQ